MLYDVLICGFLRAHQGRSTLNCLREYIRNEYGSEYDENRFQFEIDRLFKEEVINQEENIISLIKT